MCLSVCLVDLTLPHMVEDIEELDAYVCARSICNSDQHREDEEEIKAPSGFSYCFRRGDQRDRATGCHMTEQKAQNRLARQLRRCCDGGSSALRRIFSEKK